MIGQQVADDKAAAQDGIMHGARCAHQAGAGWQRGRQIDGKTELGPDFLPVGDGSGRAGRRGRGRAERSCCTRRRRRGRLRCCRRWQCPLIAKDRQGFAAPVQFVQSRRS